MDQNHESSFWKNNMRNVPGRPETRSPKRDHKKNSSASNFEHYQASVSDAWTLSEDELTKEYCILSDDPKVQSSSRRSTTRSHKNQPQIAVVHRASSSNFPNNSNLTNETANNNNDRQQQQQQHSTKESCEEEEEVEEDDEDEFDVDQDVRTSRKLSQASKINKRGKTNSSSSTIEYG
jgi:hypothetical protein